MIGVIDSGIGNIGSILNMFRRLGHPAMAAAKPGLAADCDRFLLPGVGSFDSGVLALQRSGWFEALGGLRAQGRPVLGICLGMQLLAEGSEEGSLPGLGWIPGRVRRFIAPPGVRLPIPHMGWSQIAATRPDPLLPDGAARFYFVHSYHFVCAYPAHCIATAEYGGLFTAAVRNQNIAGVQFHPEKSHRFGMVLLDRFARWRQPCAPA